MNLKEKKTKLAGLEEVNQLHPIVNELLHKIPGINYIELTHGTNEMGADFVVSKVDEILDTTVYIGIIIKTESLLQSNQDVFRQIDECDVERIIQNGGKKIYLNEIWIITSGTIANNFQKKVYEKYKNRNIQFIDSLKLISLIDEYYSFYWNDIPFYTNEYLHNMEMKVLEETNKYSLIPSGTIYVQPDIHSQEDLRNFKKRKQKLNNIEILDAIKKHKHLLIEGSMGTGKSTIIRKIVEHYSQPGNFNESKILPIKIEFSSLITDYEYDLIKVIDSHINQNIIDELKDKYEILIIVDSLDEAKAVENIEDILNTIISQSETLSNIKVLFASRFLNIDSATPLNTSIARYEIAPLSLTKIKTFVNNICQSLHIPDRFIEDLKKSSLYKCLPRNPIAAILLAKIIANNQQDLPSSIPELYMKYLELSLGRWDLDKGLQSQKEYDAAINVIKELSVYMVNNDIHSISFKEVKERFQAYFSERNMKVDIDELLERIMSRSEIISFNGDKYTVSFKHRSFMEFFYALSFTLSDMPVNLEIFDIYWSNIFFFYLGIKKDCPEIIQKVIDLKPETESQRWHRLYNLPNFLLAAYSTPYSKINLGVKSVIVEAATEYVKIKSGEYPSPFAVLPGIRLLWLMQSFMGDVLSYQYFDKALDNSVLLIYADPSLDNEIKMYSLLFIGCVLLGLGNQEPFNYLLDEFKKELPLDLLVLLKYRNEDVINQSKLLKSHIKRVNKLMKDNSLTIRTSLNELHNKPLYSKENKQKSLLPKYS